MEGFRVIAVAYRVFPATDELPHYTTRDKLNLTLLGYLAFLDPPKATATEALGKLKEHNVAVKILTGDNDIVTGTICKQVGLPVEHILLGSEIEEMNEAQLADAAEANTVFAKLSPSHKERIIHALQSKGHVVGFLGDGINDAPALKAADVGISVDKPVDMPGVVRYNFAGKQPAGAAGRRDGREGRLWEYHQVHQDGGQFEFRQHVQRAGRQHLPAFPADAAPAGTDQQPAL